MCFLNYNENELSVFLMIAGLPGSGKTVLSKRIISEYDFNYISSDEYRLKLFRNEMEQANNNILFLKINEDIVDFLNNGKNILYDATSLLSEHRIKTLSLLPACKKIIFYITTDVEECIKYDAERKRSVGEDLIREFSRLAQNPSFDEGWDKIYFCKRSAEFYGKENDYIFEELQK